MLAHFPAVAFDRSRPIPWKPLIRWAVIITVVLNVAYALFARDQYGLSLALASLGGGAFYVALGALLAKFGWQPPTARPRQAAAEARSAPPAGSGAAATADGRAKPAPTKRTNAGNRRTPPKRR